MSLGGWVLEKIIWWTIVFSDFSIIQYFYHNRFSLWCNKVALCFFFKDRLNSVFSILMYIIFFYCAWISSMSCTYSCILWYCCLYFCVWVHVYACQYAHMPMCVQCVCVNACVHTHVEARSWHTMSLSLLTLFLRQSSDPNPGTWPICLAWLVSQPLGSPSSASPTQGSRACHHTHLLYLAAGIWMQGLMLLQQAP